MTVYSYTGKLTDFGESPFPDAEPRLWVEPQRDAFSATGPSAARRIAVPVSGAGNFAVSLSASVDINPPTDYSLRCEWLGDDLAGGSYIAGWAQWDFIAQPGGGPIATMAPFLTRVWYAITPPPANRPGIYWIHPETGDVKEWVD